MNMIWHIVRKDLRHHWPEIVVWLAALGAWASDLADSDLWQWRDASDVLPVVMVVSWIVLVIRIIQSESLVGDREFWQTRPYRWGQLLAAKILPLICIVNLPLLAAQVCIIASSGLPITAALIPGLLWLQLAFFVTITLPAAGLAALTQNFAQAVLTAGAIGIGMAIFALLPWSSLPTPLAFAESLATTTWIAGSAFLLAAAIGLQYARRRVTLARSIAIAAGLLIPLIIATASTPLFRNPGFPHQGSAPISITMRGTGEKGELQYTFAKTANFGYLNLPITISGPAEDTLVSIEGDKLILTGDGGFRLESEWSPSYGLASKYGRIDQLMFPVPLHAEHELEARHARATLELALRVYKLAPAQRIDTNSKVFEIPGVGKCTWGELQWTPQRPVSAASCIAALRMPDLQMLEISSDAYTCEPDKTEPRLPAGIVADASQWNSGVAPADLEFNPIRSFTPVFGKWNPAVLSVKEGHTSLDSGFCRGTPFTLQTGRIVQHMRASFELGSLGTLKPEPAADGKPAAEKPKL